MESMDEKSRLGGGEASSAGVQEQTTVEPASAPKEPHWLDDEIDYEGQRVVELVIQIIMIASGVIGFVGGFLTNSLANCFLIVFLGAIVCSAVTIPPWPFYKRHPIKWLDDARTEKQKGERELDSEAPVWWWPF